MHGYPDYRGFNVQVVIIDGDRQLAEFVRREVNRYFPRDVVLVDRMRARLSPDTTILAAQRGCLRIVVADHEPMEAYEKLLDAIDDLTDARCLRRVDCLN
jgi:hypothetical protein